MQPPTIQLPCRSHRNCAYHAYPDPATTTAAAGRANRPTPRDSTSSPSPSPSTTTPAPNSTGETAISANANAHDRQTAPSALQNLPAELLTCVCDYLSPIDKASLALTCRALVAFLGGHVWERVSKAGTATWYRHAEFLDVLERDLGEGFWRCRDCLKFHARRTRAVEKTREESKSGMSRWKRVLGLKDAGKGEGKVLSLGMKADPIYVLDARLGKAVLERHAHGAPHGACLNSLKCSGTRIFHLSGTSDMFLSYTFTSKIVLDRLLLRATYAFTPKRTMFIRNVQVDEVSAADFLQSLDFWICGHQGLSGALERARNEPKGHVLRCRYCPTQYNVKPSPPYHSMVFDVYHNLGMWTEGRNGKWSYFVRKGRDTGEYRWGRENVQGAFDRVFCSTSEEFQRQLEISDGRGSWYDPELAECVYKTLPATMAHRM